MFSKVQAVNYEVKIIAGRFDVASSTQAATKEAGLGYTVEKTATGEFTITFSDIYSALLSAVAVPQMTNATNVQAIIKSTSATTAVIKLQAIAATIANTTITVAAADYAGAAKVHFVIHMQRTSLPAV